MNGLLLRVCRALLGHTPSANLDVAERDLVAVFLEPDVSAPRARVTRVVLELARADALLPVRGPQLVLHHFHAVEPVLDVGAADDQPRLVPRSHRLGG